MTAVLLQAVTRHSFSDEFVLPYLVGIVLLSPLIVICVLKGKPWMALGGTVFPWFLVFGAIRLAKPNSWWARRRYNGRADFWGDAKMAIALGRYSPALGRYSRVPLERPDPGPAWRVAEPGADVARFIDGEPLAHVAAGTRVVEVQRLGEHVLVTTPDGLTGWVAEDRLNIVPGQGRAGAAPTLPAVPQDEATATAIPQGGLQGWMEPDEQSDRVCWFEAGERVVVLERLGEWTHLRGPSDKWGWVKGSALGLGDFEVFACPKCGHKTAATTRGRCAYCGGPLAAADGIG